MWRRPLALLALALLPLGGCAADDPAGVDSLLEIAGPEAFFRFELRDADDAVLWRLVAEEPVPVSRIVYGEVPPGFRQEEPPNGEPPRRLRAGEPLSLESATPLRFFRHEGFAEPGQRFSIDRWVTTLRRPAPGAPPPAAPADEAPLDAPPGVS